MRTILLGSAAGGGVPQWNCRCPVCRLAWARDPRVAWRSQSSLAVTATGDRWLVVNASPDIRQQIAATPALHPREGDRHSPIDAVLLTNGDVDHVGGLLSLRERQPFALHATDSTLGALRENAMLDVLDETLVTRQAVALDMAFEPLPGLVAELFAVPGKVPLWLEGEGTRIGDATASTIGVEFRSGGRAIAYVPGCAAVTPDIIRRLAGKDAVFFDGTLWSDNEMIRLGVGAKTGRRMGHVPMSGPGGSLEALAEAMAQRRIFVHINNTNPTLVEGSHERGLAEKAGWEIGHDGLELEL